MSVLRLTLSPRLAATASLVVGGGNIVDVGTDHAYIPIYCFKTQRAENAVASDVKEGPVKIATQNIKKYGLEKLKRCSLIENDFGI